MRYPAVPVLDEAESAVEVFAGLRARLTLAEKRLIISRFGHVSIDYEDVVAVDGGAYAGPTDLRDNTKIMGGIYVLCSDGHEEWAHVPDAAGAAAAIRARSPNLCPNGVSPSEWSAQLGRPRPAARVTPTRIDDVIGALAFVGFFLALPAFVWVMAATGQADIWPPSDGGELVLLIWLVVWPTLGLAGVALMLKSRISAALSNGR